MSEEQQAVTKVRSCLGFVVNEEKTRVLLIRKDRPAAWANKFNGVGGPVRQGEDPVVAMARECEEETGVKVPESAWELRAVLDTPRGEIHVFRATGNVWSCHKKESEIPVHMPIFTDWQREPICPCVKWLLPMVLDNDLIEPPFIKVR